MYAHSRSHPAGPAARAFRTGCRARMTHVMACATALHSLVSAHQLEPLRSYIIPVRSFLLVSVGARRDTGAASCIAERAGPIEG